jgi:hypothetical protein
MVVPPLPRAGEDFVKEEEPVNKQTVGCLLLLCILVTLLGVGAWGAWFVWRELFGEEVVDVVQSVSPDGMFRCTLTDLYGDIPQGARGNHTEIAVQEWNLQADIRTRSKGDEALWEDLVRQPIPKDDSIRGSCYSIAWEYDGRHRTTGLTVFGDYGPPPRPGTVVFKMKFAKGGKGTVVYTGRPG